MKTSVAVVIVAIIVIALGAWYVLTPHTAGAPGLSTTTTPPSQGSAGTSTPQTQNDQGMQDNGVTGDGSGVSQNLILGLSSSQTLGQYLSAYNGMTLYTYAPDKQSPGKSVCNGACATAWPPYLVSSTADIHVPATLTASKVGTITRDDGTLQVTYNKSPLYFYAIDKQPGDTAGQGVGGVWFVVKQ